MKVGYQAVAGAYSDPAGSPASEATALLQTCWAWVQLLGTYPAATAVIEPD